MDSNPVPSSGGQKSKNISGIEDIVPSLQKLMCSGDVRQYPVEEARGPCLW